MVFKKKFSNLVDPLIFFFSHTENIFVMTHSSLFNISRNHDNVCTYKRRDYEKQKKYKRYTKT